MVQVISGVTLNYFTPLSISFLGVNFNKSTIILDSLIMSYMLAKFQDNLSSITTSAIKFLNFKFLYIKLCIKEDSTMEIFTILKIQCLLSTVALFLVNVMHLSHFDQILDFKFLTFSQFRVFKSCKMIIFSLDINILKKLRF